MHDKKRCNETAASHIAIYSTFHGREDVRGARGYAGEFPCLVEFVVHKKFRFLRPVLKWL